MAPSISLPDTSLLADPERLLALSYAPAERRAALAALWRLDERMGTIVATAREPAIGAMRLLWWRDALTGLDTPGAMPPAEPLLGEIALRLLPAGLPGRSIAEIEEGWAALLEAEAPGEAEIAVADFPFERGLETSRGAGVDAVEVGDRIGLAPLGHLLCLGREDFGEFVHGLCPIFASSRGAEGDAAIRSQ